MTQVRCAIKLTHDGTVAISEGARLIASIEMEKIANQRRWADLSDITIVEWILRSFDITPDNVERWLIDGWIDNQALCVSTGDDAVDLRVAGYCENSKSENLLIGTKGNNLLLNGIRRSYVSYKHITGHILGAWATSPFARQNQSAFVLVWDGGIDPRLYRVNVETRSIECLGPLFHLMGSSHAYATRFFGPFQHIWSSACSDPWNVVAGRLMAYIALGKASASLVQELESIFAKKFGSRLPGEDLMRDYVLRSGGTGDCKNALELFAAFAEQERSDQPVDVDMLRAIHDFLGELLVSRLKAHLCRLRIDQPIQLCLSGGCALNIKWNRALRESGLIHEIFVPPFCNDAGSAIGMIATDLFNAGENYLQWSPYLGPELGAEEPDPAEWAREPCDVAALATLLHETNQPVVFLNGRTELGPRALGHRSILANPRQASMRDRLNQIKGREAFRPVAPVCLEHRARAIFDPGTRDPFMLFEHEVRMPWKERVPAVIHVDGSARLQTVTLDDDPTLFNLLSEFEKLSGDPVLCNTSANFSGCGFFPDAASAAKWGGCNYVWANGKLFHRQES